jgi:outer membrane protein TolC
MTVRWFIRALFSLVLILVLSPRAARAEGPLSLEEAVRLSLALNERSLKAPQRVEVAEGGLDKARTAFLPTLTWVGTGQGQRPRDATPGGAASAASAATRVWSANGALTLNQPIVNLSSFPLYTSAKHNLESERWGAVQDKRLLAFDTARAFLVVLSSERLLVVAKDKVERARATQKDAEARAKAGLASSNDVTLALVDTAAAAVAAAQADGAVERSYLSLAFLIGKQVSGPLAVPERTLRAAELGAFRAEDVVRLAEDRRPDVRSAVEHTVSLRDSAKEPLYRLAPTLGLAGKLTLNVDPTGSDLRLWEGSAALTLTWSIYDAGVRYADRRTRDAQAESALLDEKMLRRSIATDVGLALASLRSLREAYKVAAEGVDAARRHVGEVGVLYKQGLAKGLDVVDANGRLADAETTLETTKLSMEQAYLDLRLAVGLDPQEDDNAAPPGQPSLPGLPPPAPAPAAGPRAPAPPPPPAPGPAPAPQGVRP